MTHKETPQHFRLSSPYSHSHSFSTLSVCTLYLQQTQNCACQCWRSWNRFKVRELRDGSSFFSCAPHQSRFLRFFSTFISSVSLPSPALFLFAVLSEKHTWWWSSEGRAFVLDGLFVLVLLSFQAHAYISQQPMSSCFHIQEHTNTHTCWYLCEDASVHLFLR